MQKLLYYRPTKVLDKCSSNFEKIVSRGDYNRGPTNDEVTTFIFDNDFLNIIKSNACFKTSTGTCIIT